MLEQCSVKWKAYLKISACQVYAALPGSRDAVFLSNCLKTFHEQFMICQEQKLVEMGMVQGPLRVAQDDRHLCAQRRAHMVDWL